MYIKRNSFDGEFCLFNSTSFKRIFNEIKEKRGYTKADLLYEIAEDIGSADSTIAGWLQGKTPNDGIISENGKLNEQATVVKLAKYFGVNVKELLEFPKRKEVKKVNNTKNTNREYKYNDIQTKSLYHLNDVIMEYLILKCHIMDKYADEMNFMEYFDYSKLVGNSFKLLYSENENINIVEHKKITEEEKVSAKNEEIKKIENLLKNENFAPFRALWKHRLDNIDDWMKEKATIEAKERTLMNRYSTNDADFAEFLEDKCNENSAYGYVLFEIEKASTLLRKEFIDQLLKALELAYEIYDSCVIKEKEFSVIEFLTNDEEMKELGDLKYVKFDIAELIKYLFAQEFSNYC